MADYAQVLVTSTVLPLGYQDRQYSLVADDEAGRSTDVSSSWHGPIRMNLFGDLYELPRQSGAVFQLGSFRLRVIEYEPWSGTLICAVDGLNARRLIAVRQIEQRLRWIYLRLIITTHVWGLADHNDNVVPSWRDVRILSHLHRRPNGKDERET